MFYPDLQKVRELSEKYNIIPVSMEVYADMDTPISLFKRLENNKECFLLESVEGGEKWGRYSFIGRNPFITIKGNGRSTVISYRDGREELVCRNSFQVMKELMASYSSPVLPFMPRFNGGAVGYFGYDVVRYFENLPDVPEDDIGLPELHFIFADEIIAFDHLRQKIHIIVNMKTGGNIERTYNTAIERIREIYAEISAKRCKMEYNSGLMHSRDDKPLNMQSNISCEEFCRNVLKAKEYIRNGVIFQVVLSQRFQTDYAGDPFRVYRALRIINPGPYMYYLKFDGYTLVGSSPEMLVRLEDGIVETCPIAGTRKRGMTQEEDKMLADELKADEKEQSEHIMLVDLGRNDIGKVSEFGTVTVKDFMHVEKYSHVMHLVTAVQGKAKKGVTAFDALSAVLPAGTLSGAPKVRAMEIIDELENVKRGHYGGAVGYLSFNGNLDSCITIRTILFKNGKAYIQAGCGIVADSVPQREYEETVNKAMAAVRALEEAKKII